MPQLIEEMLRRNLSGHSIRLMHSLTSLQSFDHMLELLLHNVLEAEATTSDPIADPLLPCIINLLRNQYPNKFLNILARCARKTEVAMWTFLFNAAGNPADYFKVSTTNRVYVALNDALCLRTLGILIRE